MLKKYAFSAGAKAANRFKVVVVSTCFEAAGIEHISTEEAGAEGRATPMHLMFEKRKQATLTWFARVTTRMGVDCSQPS